MPNLEPKQKLSTYIERYGYCDSYPGIGPMKHTYTFYTTQYLESPDDYSYFGIDYDSIKEKLIEQLAMEFRCELNKILYGDPAGKPYIDGLKQLKEDKETLSEREEELLLKNKIE